ncbi:MAG: hypothetical protein QXQ64_02600 [Candidatus Bathyarchaeia archaeon]
MREWETFVWKFGDIKMGRQELFIKDLTDGKYKYDTKHVVAVVSNTKGSLENADILWVRSQTGQRLETPLYISIEKEMEPWIPGKPWDDVLETLDKRNRAIGTYGQKNKNSIGSSGAKI